MLNSQDLSFPLWLRRLIEQRVLQPVQFWQFLLRVHVRRRVWVGQRHEPARGSVYGHAPCVPSAGTAPSSMGAESTAAESTASGLIFRRICIMHFEHPAGNWYVMRISLNNMND